MVSTTAAPNFLKTVLSTIASTLPLDVVNVYRHDDVGCFVCRQRVRVVDFTAERSHKESLRHQQQFEAFREMYMVRKFRLVLCADVLDCAMEYAIPVLERVAEAEKARGGLDYLLCEPLIIAEERSPRTRHCHCDEDIGWSMTQGAL